MEPDSIDLESGALVVRRRPPLALGHDPTHRFVTVSETPDGLS
jgi:hypothetical protein